MPPERKRAEQKPSFDESFTLLVDQVIDAWKDTSVKSFPIFFKGQLGVSEYYRLLALDRSKSWTGQINEKEFTITTLPNYVLRSYTILTTKVLYEKASKIEDETSKEARELNKAAEAVLNNNRQEIEKEFISVMQDSIVFAKQWKEAKLWMESRKRNKRKKPTLSRSLR